MRKLLFLCVWLCFCLAGVVRAETYTLTDGQTVTGEIVSFNESGLIVRLPNDKYSDRIPWTKFSQQDLRKLAENQRIAPLVEGFIEVTSEERLKKTEIELKQPERLDRADAHSVIGALASSPLGIIILVLLYAANLYGAYEISIFRARPAGLVCGVAAVVPLIGPLVFLCLPTQVESFEDADAPPQAAAVIQPFSVPRPSDAAAGGERAAQEAADTSGLRLASAEQPGGGAPLPPTQTFQRGAFTFNRRFFETKFPGFFGITRRDADKDMVLAVKAARGSYIATRISRITSNEMHLHVQKGPASEEVMIPFSEIQEVQLKHKDA